MNLLSRISLYYVIVSLSVFTAGGLFFYTIFRHEVYEELDEQLRDEKRNIERILSSSDTIPFLYSAVNSQIIIHPAPADLSIKLQRMDTVIVHAYEGKIPFRQWRFTFNTDKKNFIIVIRKSLIDLEDLSEKIIYAFFVSFITLLLGSLVVNFVLIKYTLHPFYQTLHQLRKYSLDHSGRLKVGHTNTKEFKELNKTLELMTERIQQDYKKIKEFTENASHEIQTPLAIIQSKLELLMQFENMGEQQASLIQTAHEAADRLSRINQTLILLTRIENREFVSKEKIDFGEITRSLLSQMNEQFLLKRLKTKITTDEPFFYAIHKSLAEILISNLLVNALRYSDAGSEININITKNSFTISNPGKPLSFEPEKLFQRFFKKANSSGSMGIGLSLVKTIADVHQLNVSYSCKNSHHVFELVA